jgi:hypothetical protein
MKNINKILVLLCVTFVLVTTSCTIEKRHYRKGFYIGSVFDSNIESESKKADTCTTVVAALKNEEGNSRVRKTKVDSSTQTAIVRDTIHARLRLKDSLPILTIGSAPRIQGHFQYTKKDEPAVQYDQTNADVRNMMLAAIGCVLLFILFQFLGAPLLVAAFVPLLPGLGSIIFAYSILLRKFIKKSVNAGLRGPDYQLSRYFRKFIFPLSVLFLGAAAFTLIQILGPALLFSATGLLILKISWAILLLAPIELLILGVIYYFYWRKKVPQPVNN